MLTAKQEKFVQNIIDGMNQADAYRNSYNVKKMSDNAIYREASLLMENPKVSQRLTELREEMIKPTIMSAQERLEWLTNVVRGNCMVSDKLKAVDLMNKMSGEYTTKVQATMSYEDNLKKVVDEDEY